MEKQANIKSLILVISISFGIEANAISAKTNNKDLRIKQAKIATAQIFRLSYILLGAWHMLRAGTAAIIDMNDKRIATISELLWQLSKRSLVDLGGSYGSFYSSYALSDYIKQLRDNKISTAKLTDSAGDLDQEVNEDIEKTLAELLLHSWVIVSSGILMSNDLDIHTHAFRMKFDPTYLPKTKADLPGVWLNEDDKKDLVRKSFVVPILAPSRLYPAYKSFKTILSKLKTLMPNNKKELVKAN